MPIYRYLKQMTAFLLAQTIKSLTAMQETRVWFLRSEEPVEKGMAAHSSILAWRSRWTEEPGEIQSMGAQRVGHNRVTNTFTSLLKETEIIVFNIKDQLPVRFYPNLTVLLLGILENLNNFIFNSLTHVTPLMLI